MSHNMEYVARIWALYDKNSKKFYAFEIERSKVQGYLNDILNSAISHYGEKEANAMFDFSILRYDLPEIYKNTK